MRRKIAASIVFSLFAPREQGSHSIKGRKFTLLLTPPERRRVKKQKVRFLFFQSSFPRAKALRKAVILKETLRARGKAADRRVFLCGASFGAFIR